MRKLFPVIFILCITGAWMSIAYRNVSVPAAYRDALAGARDACEKGYYVEAQQRLNQAEEIQTLQGNYEADALQRDIYYGMQDLYAYEEQLQSMIEEYPEKEENYESLILYYQNIGDTGSLCSLLPEYLEKWPDNEAIVRADENLSMQYKYVRVGYYDVKYASPSLVDIQEREYETDGEETTVRRKLVDSRGSTVLDGGYAQMSVSQDGYSCFVCGQEGNWSRVDGSGNLLARNTEVSFESIGSLAANNLATAVIGGQYHFTNARMEISEAAWEAAGTFHDGVNAVKQNGRWAFVTTENWQEISGFPYTDIPRNSLGYCVTEGYGVAADEKGYYVISVEDMLPVSSNTYEELKAFESSQPTAYRSGDKWGFVSNQGEIWLEAYYEDARPFVNGYAAVKQNGLWGYIDRQGRMVVEPQFRDALNVLESGYAYVQEDTGYWSYLILDRLYYAD